MDNPIKVTTELSKEEKLKRLNEKLNIMLKSKNVDPLKFPAQSAPETKTQSKIANPKQQEKSMGREKSIVKEQEEEEQQQREKLPEKSKMIKKQEKKTLRKAAGEVWEDKTMEDWPDNDYRIFCGNLGNEVNDQILSSVFRRYSSFQMGRVVRDRRTGKTRGYGFVSFLSPTDFLNALKDMNGKHVGNRPVKLMKSSWKDRDLNSAKNQFLPSDFRKNAQKETHKINIDYRYVSSL